MHTVTPIVLGSFASAKVCKRCVVNSLVSGRNSHLRSCLAYGQTWGEKRPTPPTLTPLEALASRAALMVLILRSPAPPFPLCIRPVGTSPNADTSRNAKLQTLKLFCSIHVPRPLASNFRLDCSGSVTRLPLRL